MADALHFFQPMADVEHRAALARQPLQGDEQMIGLVRGEHRGRLVHDQKLRRLQQAANDLDALAFADRKIGDERVRAQRQAVIGGNPFDGRSKPVAHFLRQGERDIFRHGQRIEQREVLEHHADAEAAGGGRIGNRARLALPAELARTRLQRAIDDLHQRRFAGAVFTEQGMDFAREQIEVDRSRSL